MIRQGALSQGERHLDFWTASLVDASYVYVIQGDPDTPIKVGVARDVVARIDTLQTGNPQVLNLLHLVPGDHVLEWNLHQRLKPDRILGEWFAGDLVGEFLAFVEHLAEQMVAAHDGGPTAPHYSDFGTFDLRMPVAPPDRVEPAEAPSRRRKKWRVSGPRGAVTVRYVEPSPKLDPVEARETRERLRGLPRSAYLDSPNTLMRRRISPSAGFGNR